MVKSQNIERLFKIRRVTSFTYDILQKSVAMQPAIAQQKWNKHLLYPVRDWTTYHSIPSLCTCACRLRSFPLRIFHRTIGTNALLKKMGIKDCDECFFCDSRPKTIEQLFWYCDWIFPLWSTLTNY